MNHFSTGMYWILAVLAVASCIFNGLVLISAGSFRRYLFRERRRERTFLPPVSVLKPIRGADEKTEACLRSFFSLDYPEFELVFALHEEDDPALDIITRLKTEFPDVPTTTVFRPSPIGLNAKVCNIHNGLTLARHEIVAVSDADILVEPDYLKAVVAPLENPEVGVVTCLYRGIPGEKVTSVFESLGLGGDFVLGALVARMTEGLSFAFGSTLAFRRTTLDAIGGIERIAEYLGDDYMIGNFAKKAGYEVALAPFLVETTVPEYTWAGYFSHQLRWARNIKTLRFGGYLGLLFTFSTVWALALVGFFPTHRGAFFAALAALIFRFAAAIAGATVLEDAGLRRNLLWLPLRDLTAFGVWLWSFLGNTVEWRGTTFTIEPDGKITPYYDLPAAESATPEAFD
jgi:ceramide glucosyltransferase